ncbi:MAG: sugar ABC transporter permease [Anaerolineae bacterium]|nr:sugar ABC transporter permease [Anaerolineae bacterium]NPV09891.1 sugar ABC transporter permease [Anaerolineae bacterium]
MAAPWIVGFFTLTLGPMLASVYFSLTDYSVLQPPRFVGLDNFRVMFFEDPRYFTVLYNTMYYTVLHVPLSMILALTVAILLNQGLPGENVLRTIYYMPSVVSGVAVSMLWLWLFDPNLGLVNVVLGWVGIQGPVWLMDPNWSKPALVLMSMWGIGGQMVIFLAGLQGVPQEMYEAAMVDGASWWHKIRFVTVPLITPTIFFNLIMGVIGSFQVFTSAYVMTNGGPVNSTLFYVLYLYESAFRYFEMGYACALAWVLFFIIMAFTLVQFYTSGKWVYYEMPASRARAA